jgi:hypothetical protein
MFISGKIVLKIYVKNLEREKGVLVENHKWIELAKCQ